MKLSLVKMLTCFIVASPYWANATDCNFSFNQKITSTNYINSDHDAAAYGYQNHYMGNINFGNQKIPLYIQVLNDDIRSESEKSNAANNAKKDILYKMEKFYITSPELENRIHQFALFYDEDGNFFHFVPHDHLIEESELSKLAPKKHFLVQSKSGDLFSTETIIAGKTTGDFEGIYNDEVLSVLRYFFPNDHQLFHPTLPKTDSICHFEVKDRRDNPKENMVEFTSGGINHSIRYSVYESNENMYINYSHTKHKYSLHFEKLLEESKLFNKLFSELQ